MNGGEEKTAREGILPKATAAVVDVVFKSPESGVVFMVRAVGGVGGSEGVLFYRGWVGFHLLVRRIYELAR